MRNPCKACGLHEENVQLPSDDPMNRFFYICETVPPGMAYSRNLKEVVRG